MAHPKRILCSLSIALFLIGNASPAGKQRDFQTGKLLDVGTEEKFVAGTSYRFATFTVQLGDIVYLCTGDRLGRVKTSVMAAAITRPGDSGSEFVVGDPVKAAIDGEHLILIKPNGKELKVKIAKRTRASQ